jgi:hypothetical protein
MKVVNETMFAFLINLYEIKTHAFMYHETTNQINCKCQSVDRWNIAFDRVTQYNHIIRIRSINCEFL